MICPTILAAYLSTDVYNRASAERRATCLGPACALWLPEINGTPARPTGRGNCAHNPKAPTRKPEE